MLCCPLPDCSHKCQTENTLFGHLMIDHGKNEIVAALLSLHEKDQGLKAKALTFKQLCTANKGTDDGVIGCFDCVLNSDDEDMKRPCEDECDPVPKFIPTEAI